ncbi:MAG: nitroreductase family protein [Candidatus Thermoplasmatota archaeon]|nr:nitroreductase family protein [Candidatus Thermoplasmatota archaeon]
MSQKQYWKKGLVCVLLAFCCCMAITPALNAAESSEDYLLPPPLHVSSSLETAMFQRMSVREFTTEPVTDDELSTVLWAACGYQIDGGRTIAGINGTYAGIIYVLKEDAAYTYDPWNHSLVFFKAGDWRNIVGWQYEAPIQLGLCYNTTKADAKFAGAELGQIGQNIQFMANALGLGTVVCGQTPPAIDPLGIPESQEGMIVMPLGHPLHPYDFKHRPLWLSLLPRVQSSTLSLSDALENRTEHSSFTGELSRAMLSQIVWSTYGLSPSLDRSEQELNSIHRHRTVPSAHGYYPFDIYVVTEKSISYYQPNLLIKVNTLINVSAPIDFIGLPILTYLRVVKAGDHRTELAAASAEPTISSAPAILVIVLDVERTRPQWHDDLSGEQFRQFWYFEAGASTHNVLLEATAWDLTSTIVLPRDTGAIQSLLRLPDECLPLFLMPVGS